MNTDDVVNRFLQRVGEQDADGIADLFDEEIDWYVPGNEALPWTGRRSKRSEVPHYFHAMWPAFSPGKSVVEVEAVLVDGDHAAVFAHFSHVVHVTGRPFSTPSVFHIVVRDGKIVKMHLYEDTAAVSDAFMNRP
ncbi:nuclear transport factor 2 family protein [Herbiconiux sp. CPCC 205763]|uniref:Nuclear transport factor 2 family protein n=1 Tax=Herbiconiux aconitum TaxID=2970913 RepID=A0ABT2GQF4_9MICO|nr:nuclear transport factor 2 family protein [Herbiconiux aconitum]MCS5717797.1 nuclear transport factor 2 family protein [Herbiconiux aconitum]